MLYLTFHDDPFSGQEHDETALLELVRAVARRDSDDRTLSELIKFQDALERLGLLWAPFDCLQKSQSIELVRNLHLEFSAPGDMVHLKHSPAMRSYVVLTGKVLISKNLLDREGVEGTRVLGQGDEFGITLRSDRSPDDTLADFGEYAQTEEAKHCHDNTDKNLAARARQGQRTDVKTELLSIRLQDWHALLQGSRAVFARMVALDAAYKDPDPLKVAAREVFDMEAKGRNEEHIKIAVDYLVERVPFCRDLPLEQLTAMASSLELRELMVPGRVIFRRGRECYGEAYLMFTGTADQRGGGRSGDRLIKEGDIFGTEHFGAGTGDVQETKFRTTTAVNRTAPCELLVLPTRERQQLQAFIAVRNSENAMLVFETHFHNMPRETREGLSALASFRKLTMHEVLVSAGEEVKAVFFVSRGECITKAKRQKGRSQSEQRFGPGHVVGWRHLMMDSRAALPTISRTGVAVAAARVPHTEDSGVPGRPPRYDTAWEDNFVVATPAQVLSVPRLALLNGLSAEALDGLRRYITAIQGGTNSSEEDLEANNTLSLCRDDNATTSGGCGYEDHEEKGVNSTNGIDVSAYFGDGFQQSRTRSRRRVHNACAGARPVKAPEAAFHALGVARTRRPRTAHVTLARWRWREKLGEGTLCVTSSSSVNRIRASTADEAARGFASSESRQMRKYSGCCCPLFRCLGCSASQRLQRFHQTPPWAPVRHTRSIMGNVCSRRSDRHSTAVGGTAADARCKDSQKLVEEQSHEITRQCDLERTVITGGKDDSSGSVGGASESDGSISIQGSLGPQSPRLATVNLASGGASAGLVFNHGHSGGPKPGVRVVMGLRQAGMAAIAQAERRAAQRIYTLVQLSRRSGLDPSEPLAATCLRLLGSFETEAEVTTLVFNLYYTVLPQKPAWRPFHRTDKYSLAGLETASDIVFLLRKGAPVQSLRFDVSTNSLSTSSSGDERKAQNDVDIGRGYDRRYPSVFKAKEQYFAVALLPSADRVAEEWQKQQDGCNRRLKKQAVKEADEKAVAIPSSEVDGECNPGVNQGQLDRQRSLLRAGGAIAHQDGNNNEREAAEDASKANTFGANKVKIEPADTAAEILTDAGRVDPSGTAHRVSGTNDDPDDAGVTSTTTSRELTAGTDEKGSDGRGMVDVVSEMATNSADEGVCEGGGGMYASPKNAGRGQGSCEGQHSGVDTIGPSSEVDTGIAEDRRSAKLTPSFSDLLIMHGTESVEDDTTTTLHRIEGQAASSTATAAGFLGENPVCKGNDERDERISWILNRMALLDKVEGCYETEAMAFKKAVRILDGMEARDIGDAIITPSSSKPGCTSAHDRVHHSNKSCRVCVLPLYHWLSLGDSGIDGLEGVIRKYSVADTPEAIGKGLDTTAVWMEQRASSLRSNLYNMLIAAGPREIRSRCSARVSCAPAASARVTGAELRDYGEGVHHEEADPAVGVEREGSSNSGDRQSGKKGIEMVQAAREAVLRQNQKLIDTEVKVRNRILANFSIVPGAETRPQDGGGSMPHCSFTSTSEAAVGTIMPNDKRPYGSPDDASPTSIDVRREEGRAGSGKGSRQELHVQMSIERKRARLFEDIQMLPYARVKNGRKRSGDKKRTATVPRPTTVHSQIRLHGKPASSIFAKVRTVPVASPVGELSLAPTAVKKGEGDNALGVCASSLELPSAEIPVTGPGDTKVGFHSSPKVPLDARDTPRAARVASKADSASPSLEEEVDSIVTGSAVLGNGASIGCGESAPTVTTEISSPKFTVAAVINSRRCMSTAFGGRGRHAVRKGGDDLGHIRTTPCSLDGELMLLDGVLHDPHVRAWVENSLGSSIIRKR